MAQNPVNSNSTQPLGIPNTGTGTDQGDTWDTAIVKINGMFAEVYAGKSSIPRTITSITTAGAGTLTAAAIVGGIIARSGPTGAFTDTTDTAAAIIAARTGALVGSSWGIDIENTTAFTETLAAGTGVTLAGLTVIPAGSTLTALVQYTAAGAITITGYLIAAITGIPPVQYSALNATAGTLGAGVITGAENVYVLSTNATPGTQTTRTATQMFGDIPNCAVGFTYTLRITNSGAGTLTLGAGSGVTLGSGTYTVPTNTFRDFTVNFTSATACTIQTTGVGTWS
jgi:hypothetical protein